MQATVPNWWSIALQVLSALVSIIAVIGFIKSGQKTKVEQAEAMMEMSHSIKVLADAQVRADDKLDDAVEESKKDRQTMWKRIDEIKERQTTLCTMHGLNHPGQTP